MNLLQFGKNEWCIMTIKELRSKTGLSQKAFAEYLNIPQRSIENWESGARIAPSYVIELIEYRLKNEDRLKEQNDTGIMKS